jgi:hypothetical protein
LRKEFSIQGEKIQAKRRKDINFTSESTPDKHEEEEEEEENEE